MDRGACLPARLAWGGADAAGARSPYRIKHLLRPTITEMEEQLDPARFARIQRSTIVNVDRVREIVPEPHGDCDVILEGGAGPIA